MELVGFFEFLVPMSGGQDLLKVLSTTGPGLPALDPRVHPSLRA